MAYNDTQQNTGLYVPTTNIWDDMEQIGSVDVNSDHFKELLVRLYQNIGNIALALNKKDSALYLQEEFVNGQVFFNPLSSNPDDLRPCFRILVNVGALNAAAQVSVNHGITVDNFTTFTYIAGAASNTTSMTYYPIPYAGAANVYISVTAGQYQITVNNQTAINFTNVYIVLEYLKS